MSISKKVKSQSTIIDAHHHFIDTKNSFHQFLASLGASTYLPEDYCQDTNDFDLPICTTVHMEALPDSSIDEVVWLERLILEGRAPMVGAIVAQCNLALDNTESYLDKLVAASPSRLRGIRYILDYDGPYNSSNSNATHVACSRHNIDYLRDPNESVKFERGLCMLHSRGLSFDLQCCPAQLPAAFEIFRRNADVRVCINHLGKPRHLLYDNESNSEAKLSEWRHGMQLMATLPNVFVKISMLGYAVPGDKNKKPVAVHLWAYKNIQYIVVIQFLNECMYVYGNDFSAFKTCRFVWMDGWIYVCAYT